MSILEITNRSENWKTACRFSPLFRDNDARLRLAKRLCEPGETKPDQVHFELFWYGMRDYLKGKRGPNKRYFPDLVKRYNCLFPKLHREIEKFVDQGRFKKLQGINYNPSIENGEYTLGNNLSHTEIDVVLETPNNLYIGEAKDESNFNADSRRVLVHQLIRQYVMASILVKRLVSEGHAPKKTVIPFVVGNDTEKIKKNGQVKFMIRQGWLKKENVLSWECIENLARNL